MAPHEVLTPARRAIAAALAVALFLAWIAVDPFGEQGSVAFVDIALLLAAAAAAAACFARARAAHTTPDAPTRSGRAAWLLYGAACGLWAGGQLVWTVEQLLFDRALPFPSAADVLFLAFGPLASAALMLNVGRRPGLPALRTLLDALGTALPLLFTTWLVGVKDTWADPALSFVERVVLTSYPLRDVLLVAVAVPVVAHYRGRSRRVAALIAASFATLAFTNSVYVAQLVHGSYESGGVLDAGWLVAFLLMALAASDSARSAAQPEAPAPAEPTQPAQPAVARNTVLHYASLVVSSIAGIWAGFTNQLDSLALAMIFAAVWLFIARQLLGDFEIRRLTRRLAAQLAEATQLQAKTDLAVRAVNMITWEMDLTTSQVEARPPAANDAGFVPASGDFEAQVLHFVHPDDLAHHRAWFEQLRGGDERSPSCVYRLRTADGYRRVESRATILRDADGTPTRIIGATIDLTDRLADEQRRHDAEQRFRSVFESSPVGLSLLDLDGRLLDVNPAMTRIMRAERDDLVGRLVTDFVVDSAASSARLDALREGTQVASRQGYTRGDGTVGIINVVSTAICDPDGRPQYFVSASEDVTEHEQARAALSESERRLRHVVEASPTAIVETDADGLVQVWNAAATRLFGWTAEEVVGRPLPGADPALEDALRNMIDSLGDRDGDDKSVAWGGPRVRKDGTMVDVMVSLVPLRGPDGRVGRLRLITERDAHGRHEDQLNEFRRMQALGRLAGGIAHDFNNLLTAIVGCSDLLAMEIPPDSPLAWEVDAIRTAGRQAADLTSQLLTFSRGGSTALEAVAIDPMVESLTTLLRRLVGERIELTCDLGAGGAFVTANKAMLEQVLANLVANARDAMPDGGRVTVRTECAPHAQGDDPSLYVRMSVIDEGSGMAPSVFARCMEPFFTTKGPGQGTGLGLSQVYGSVVGAGGSVDVDTTAGRGTAVTVHLPVAQAPASASASPDHRAKRSIRAEPVRDAAPAPLVVLVAEDDPQVRVLTVRLLRREGHTVIHAEDGEEALLLSESYPGDIDLLVTDIVMPGLNGVEVADELQRRRPGLRTLFMSGYPGDEGTAALAHDDRPRICKPFVPSALVSAVGRAAAKDPAV